MRVWIIGAVAFEASAHVDKAHYIVPETLILMETDYIPGYPFCVKTDTIRISQPHFPLISTRDLPESSQYKCTLPVGRVHIYTTLLLQISPDLIIQFLSRFITNSNESTCGSIRRRVCLRRHFQCIVQ